MNEHAGYDPEYPYATRTDPPAGPPGKPRADADSAAIAGLIMAFFFPPLGFILGAVSQGQAKRHGLRQSGVATAAMILGAAFTGITVLAIVVIIASAAKSGDYQACVNNAISYGGGDVSTCTP